MVEHRYITWPEVGRFDPTSLHVWISSLRGEAARIMTSPWPVRLRWDPLALVVGSESIAFVATSDVAKRDPFGPVAQVG